MKKLTQIWILSLLFTVGCGDTKTTINSGQNKDVLQTTKKEEDLLITKVSAAFHQIIQDDQAWKTLQIVIEDNIIMKNETIRDDVLPKADDTIKDDVLPHAYLTIREDLIMGLTSLKDIDIKGIRFSDRLVKEYNALFKENIAFHDIEKNLYKLHFAIPKFAISNPNKWKEEGRPLSAKAYVLDKERLEAISRDQAKKMLGLEQLDRLVTAAQIESPNFYTIENEGGLHMIAGNKNKGALLTQTNNKITLQAFQINDHNFYNTITLKNGSETSTYFQRKLINQIYVPRIPTTPTNTCVGFYLFDCNSQEASIRAARNQAIADETCDTVWECIPCCTNGLGVIFATSIYEPQSPKCMKFDVALDMISEYSISSGTNTFNQTTL